MINLRALRDRPILGMVCCGVLLASGVGVLLWPRVQTAIRPARMRAAVRPTTEDFAPFRLRLPEPPFTECPLKAVGEVSAALKPDELVLGVTVGGESRAYPIAMLNAEFRRKVLNDTLAGRALAAIW